MSSADIGAGTRWSAKIAEALASTKIGILCITSDNQRESWLLFEAGALAKTLDDTFVCPYLIQMHAADLAPGPLTQFQAKLADQEGTFELLSTINSALGSEALSLDRLRRLFDRSWPDLERKFKSLPTSPARIDRPQAEVLTEILDMVRSLARRMPLAPTPPPELPSPSPDFSRGERIHLEGLLLDVLSVSPVDPVVVAETLRGVRTEELRWFTDALRDPERGRRILDRLHRAWKFRQSIDPSTIEPQRVSGSSPTVTNRTRQPQGASDSSSDRRD